MKTAISLPDKLFERAEQVAARLGISRSELYAQALQTFIVKHEQESITEALNAVYAEQPSTLEPDVWHMQAASLKEDW